VNDVISSRPVLRDSSAPVLGAHYYSNRANNELHCSQQLLLEYS